MDESIKIDNGIISSLWWHEIFIKDLDVSDEEILSNNWTRLLSHVDGGRQKQNFFNNIIKEFVRQGNIIFLFCNFCGTRLNDFKDEDCLPLMLHNFHAS